VAFAIVADLPLGTYRGAGADGGPERIPSVARLHSALLCAAGFGPRAVEGIHDSLDLADNDVLALRWLEDNPPDSVRIPALEVNLERAVAYRDDGTLKKPPKSSALTIKKLPKAPDAATAVDGQFVWIWKQDPPEQVLAALEQLCPDVPYLGTSESPVRLTAVTGDDFEASHDLNQDAGLFTVGGTGIDRPVAGRLAELSEAHRAATGTPPSAARDSYTTDERSRSAVPGRQAVETAWYTPRKAELTEVPWPQVITIPMDVPVPAQDRVAWAVAAHRALISMIGPGAPALITGAYPAGTRRPANRIALHLLDADTAPQVQRPCLLIMIPTNPDPADLEVLQQAVAALRLLRGPSGRTRELDLTGIRVMEGSRFWSPPQAGAIRLWRTVPAAIPDTRGSRNAEWNFTHAALLSVGFVWKDLRDRLPKISGHGDAYYRSLAAAVSGAGVAIVHARAVRSTDVGRYVHKVNADAVVRPYTAYLSLGSLAGLRTITAIGQSRHLGGGLLLPFDVPEGAIAEEILLPGEGEA
jgi:CRISPR-associated protein Csb2